MIYYTGIGSRETPKAILDIMEDLANWCSEKGCILRSGGADGADTAFETGCNNWGGDKEIYIPWGNFNDRSVSEEGIFVRGNDVNSREIASTIHPVFYSLGRGAQALHARNVNQVLGRDSSNPDPSSFLIYFAPRTKNGNIKGGTATAVKLAERFGVDCWNMFDNHKIEDIKSWIEMKL